MSEEQTEAQISTTNSMPARNLSFCMVTSFYPPYNIGGDGILLYRLSNELAKRGHKVTIVHCIDAYFAKKKEMNKGRWPNHPNVKVYGIHTKLGVLSPLFSMVSGHPGFKKQTLKNILSKRYDVIHYHTVSLIGGPHVFSMGKALKLFTTHDYWAMCPTYFLYKYDREICENKNCFICSTVFTKRPPQIWRYTSSMKKHLSSIDAIIGPSKFVIKRHEQEIKDIPMVHIPLFANGFEPPSEEADAHIQSYKKNGKRYFLFVGRLVHNKGVHVLIDSFQGINDRNLLIIGDGPYRKELEKLKGASTNIVFLGEQTGDTLSAAFRNAAALIIPSLCLEVGGTVGIEAMSCGIPLVVNDIGGLSELAQENKTGLVYRSPDELRSILSCFNENDPSIRGFRENGPKAWKRRYSRDAHIRSYLQLIQSMLER